MMINKENAAVAMIAVRPEEAAQPAFSTVLVCRRGTIATDGYMLARVGAPELLIEETPAEVDLTPVKRPVVKVDRAVMLDMLDKLQWRDEVSKHGVLVFGEPLEKRLPTLLTEIVMPERKAEVLDREDIIWPHPDEILPSAAPPDVSFGITYRYLKKLVDFLGNVLEGEDDLVVFHHWEKPGFLYIRGETARAQNVDVFMRTVFCDKEEYEPPEPWFRDVAEGVFIKKSEKMACEKGKK